MLNEGIFNLLLYSSRRKAPLSFISCQHSTAVTSKYDIIDSKNLKCDLNSDFIGEGGFCCVYRAQHADKTFVAVKRLKSVIMYGSEAHKNFMRKEARCLKSLLHPNVIKFLGIVWEQNYHAVVLEYATNGDLINFMQKQTLHPYLKAKLLCDVAKGVSYLHWLPKQIIHNDLKASNILVSDDITAKITDFSTAYWQSMTTELYYVQSEENNLKAATCTHVSPERWLDENQSNTKSDVYSYGIIIWETYSEQSPFALIKGTERIKLAVTSGQRPDKKLLQKTMPIEMNELMLQCWHQEPSERPEMRNVVEQLKDFLSNGETIKKTVDLAIMQCILSSAKDIEKLANVIESSAKDIELSVKDIETSAKDAEPSAKDSELSVKDIETSNKNTEPSAKDSESSVKDIETSTKGIESADKVIETSIEGIESANKVIETSTEGIESADKVIETSTEGIESADKAIELPARDIEQFAIDIQPSAKDVESSAKHIANTICNDDVMELSNLTGLEIPRKNYLKAKAPLITAGKTVSNF